MYNQVLKQAGLTEKQAKIYCACLELGQSKASEIAKKSEIKRSTAYGVLDELAHLGLISSTFKGNTKLFSAEHPKAIINMLESNKKKIESIVPELENMFATHHLRPILQFFEGLEGFKGVLEDSLKCRGKKIFQIVKVTEWNRLLGSEYTTEYIKDRALKGIWAYAIHPKSNDTHDIIYGKESEKWKRRVRYLPPNMFYASTIMIYDHKVAMLSTSKENFGFIIESKEFANTFRSYFEFMWTVGSKEPE